ncbi:MAG TPA: LuxR C-terminal-related transcriptional regulator [Jatrophihabitantaceae bacterium]
MLGRKDLLLLLDRAVTKRLTVLSAPPGSGKTSLLRAWAARRRQRIAFVSVDRDQRSDYRFWCAVLDAFRVPPGSGDETPAVPTGALEVAQVIDSVLAELAKHVDPVVLIIDDLHELKSADALTQLEGFLATMPSSAHVVLSSRRDPPIRLHSLRLADQIAEIRSSELRFTEQETRDLLAASAISLSGAGVAALHKRTEGWAAGLRLAVIALSDHRDPERFVAEFSGTDRAIGEYLMAEMLEGQPSDVQAMLLRTSVVERMNGELADLLTGRCGSERTLLALEEANAFVVSLDPHRTWFRYHQLLADFLRLELRRTSADEVPDLHRRAARWYADRGDIVEAVRHRIAAGDWPDAARLVADHSFRWVLDGQAETIRAAMQLFPEGASVDHPDLALAHAAAELNRGWVIEAAAQLALAESQLHSAAPSRRPRLTVAIASLRLALARRSGQFSEVIEQVKLLDTSMADTSSEAAAVGNELRGVALLNLGIVETWTGRLSEAEQHLAEGAALAEAIGRPYLEVACRAHQGFPSKLISVAAARERGERAVALAERYALADRPILAPALGAVGGMAIWMGEFDEGERWLRRAWEVGSVHLEPATAVLLHLAAGMVHAGRGQQQSALDAFTAAARTQSLLTGAHALAPRIAGWLATTQSRLGMSAQARATLAAYSGDPQRMGPVANAQAWIQLADGDAGMALAALHEVRDGGEHVDPFTLVEAHLLAGNAHLRLGDRLAAAAAAEAALATAEPDRLIFPFAMTEAAQLLDVLHHHETAHAGLLAAIVDQLRGGSVPSTGREPSSRLDELSPSELRVLGYLPTNLTRPEIAHELHVSINTVNTHIRNVYAKLGAQDRSGAVQRARELRLLSNRLAPTSPT